MKLLQSIAGMSNTAETLPSRKLRYARAAALFRSLALLSWPQAAMMSRPRGVRTVQVRPPSRQIVMKARMRFWLEHS